MKVILWILVLALVGWWVIGRLKRNPMVQEVQQAPVRYVNSLQHSVEKANAVKDLANRKIEEDGKQLRQSLKEIEGN